MSIALALHHAVTNSIIGLPRMAAVIADRRRVVAIGFNSRKSHPMAARFGRNAESIYLHAEVAALAAAREPVAGFAMYIARVYRDNRPALAKPCSGCVRALAAFGITEVHWTC